MRIEINATGFSNQKTVGVRNASTVFEYSGYIVLGISMSNSDNANSSSTVNINDYTSNGANWSVSSIYAASSGVGAINGAGGWNYYLGAPVTSLRIDGSGGTSLNGTVLLYGVN
jgi:hypothetical protein